jgi:hypothetical protein
MAPKHHPTPLSGGDRKARSKELTKARAMTVILSARADEARRAGEALIQEADNLLCQSWNERMWADGGPIDPSPTVDQAINGGYPWLEIRCSRCRTPRSVDLAGLRHAETLKRSGQSDLTNADGLRMDAFRAQALAYRGMARGEILTIAEVREPVNLG